MLGEYSSVTLYTLKLFLCILNDLWMHLLGDSESGARRHLSLIVLISISEHHEFCFAFYFVVGQTSSLEAWMTMDVKVLLIVDRHAQGIV